MDDKDKLQACRDDPPETIHCANMDNSWDKVWRQMIQDIVDNWGDREDEACRKSQEAEFDALLEKVAGDRDGR